MIRSLHVGGAEGQLAILAKGLRRRGLDVTIATYYPGGALEEDLRSAGVRTVCLHKRGRWDLLPFLFRFLRLIRSEKPDIVHGYLSSANLILLALAPALRALDARVVCGVRASPMLPSAYDVATRLMLLIESRLMWQADEVIANSNAAMNALRRGKTRRGVVVPNGIDVDKFQFSPQARDAQREAWHVSKDDVLIGVVSRLDPMKNHIGIMQAATLVVQRYPHVKFAFVGTGTPAYCERLKAEARSLSLCDHIVWTGFAKDMVAVYSAFDLCCLASNWGEGFPNALAEAMSCGLACVSTDVGEAAAIVGDAGWIVPVGSADRLADVLAAAIQARSECDRAAVRQRIASQFSTERMVDRTLASLTALVSARS